MPFYGRKRELESLDKMYARPGAQMFVLYGRRRVGKTVLLEHWLATRKHPVFFWTADRTSAGAQLRSFSQALQAYRFPKETVAPEFTFTSWELALNELGRVAESEPRLVVVLDEFTYLLQSDSALSSILQRLWDHTLKRKNLLLILTGSHAGMITREILTYRSPLYNRASAHLHLQPLPFGDLAAFFPRYDAEARAKIYACVGGVPQYLELLDPAAAVDENLKSLLSASLIIDDAGTLLRDQLDEPRNYVAVVEAIASGYTRSTEIGLMAGLQASSVSKYLSVLQQLGIVLRDVPATQSRPAQSKQGRYRLTDHYLRFYYRFLAPNRANLERGLTTQAWLNLQKHLPEFVGLHLFEELCREWVLREGDASRLPFAPRRVGSFWGTRLPQIDVVAINEDAHALLLGECKWTQDPLGAGVVKDFLERAPLIIPEPADRWEVTYVFFSRAGFTDEARAAGAAHNCLWRTLDQIDRQLRDR